MAHSPIQRNWRCLVTLTSAWQLGVDHDDQALTHIAFLLRAAPASAHPSETAAGRALERRIHEAFQAWHRDPSYRFDLPLKPSGTDFQHRVWQAIASIPPATTQRYGDLAKSLGTAARAVGGACGANPLPVIVPCHRVVAVQGLGGFNREQGGWLRDIKRWLLEREGVM